MRGSYRPFLRVAGPAERRCRRLPSRCRRPPWGCRFDISSLLDAGRFVSLGSFCLIPKEPSGVLSPVTPELVFFSHNRSSLLFLHPFALPREAARRHVRS